jgi:hypothetical protein
LGAALVDLGVVDRLRKAGAAGEIRTPDKPFRKPLSS